MKTDVMIAGAGPTGLALAAQLQRHGVDFAIVDKKQGTTTYSKAIGVQARTLEIYEQIGLAEPLIAEGTIAERVRMIVGGHTRGELDLTDVGKGLSPYPFLLLVEQGAHERLLHEHLKANARDVLWGTELTEFSQTPDAVHGTLTTADGARSFEAKYLVGCDGAHSIVRSTLGMTFEGGTFERLFYVADVEIDWESGHDAVQVCFAKNTITAFFPLAGSDRNFRIVGTFPEGHDRDEKDILYEEIEQQIVRDTELQLDITRVNWFSVYKVHSRAVNKFSAGRCFLAGDSAHIHTPAGAQGMNTGIQDGYNLAWKLAAAIKGWADEKIIDSYNEERLPNARQLLRTTDRLFHLGASDDRLLAFVRTEILPYLGGFALSLDVVRKAIFPIVSQTGINYRNSSLSRGSDSLNIKPGDRMPYFSIEGAGIYDSIRAPKFHVLLFHDGAGTAQDLSEFASESVDVHSFPLFPHISEMFDTRESFVLLLRPDNYIGLISEGTSMEAVKEYFASLGPI